MEEKQRFQDQAMLITGEIFHLMNEYTNDSNVSKFFLTDNTARVCYSLAGGFAAAIYSPELKPKELKDTAILSFIYTLITYGFNIYLRERSLITNSAPYRLPTNIQKLRGIQKQILDKISEGSLVMTPLAEQIIKIILENVKNQMALKELRVRGHRLIKTKFFDYSKLSLYWGYNFARELIKESAKS